MPLDDPAQFFGRCMRHATRFQQLAGSLPDHLLLSCAKKDLCNLDRYQFWFAVGYNGIADLNPSNKVHSCFAR